MRGNRSKSLTLDTITIGVEHGTFDSHTTGWSWCSPCVPFFSNLISFEDEDELDAQSRWLTRIQREEGRRRSES